MKRKKKKKKLLQKHTIEELFITFETLRIICPNLKPLKTNLAIFQNKIKSIG
jgi:hypothetical protein